tara:strand:+ start:139 stop:648 length:510 start_codon:yes stop_codon:yes gene_type:complete
MKKLALAATLTGLATLGAAGLAFAQDEGETKDRADRGEARAERMLERFDTNSDGVISTDEIEAMKAERFSQSDANGDGSLTLAELEAWKEAEREARMQARKERMFARRDTNGDGVISIDEFETRGMSMFERVDADGDGEITKAELAEMQGHHGGHRGGWHHRGGGADRK